jgi:hypothetical protein
MFDSTGYKIEKALEALMEEYFERFGNMLRDLLEEYR